MKLLNSIIYLFVIFSLENLSKTYDLKKMKENLSYSDSVFIFVA